MEQNPTEWYHLDKDGNKIHLGDYFETGLGEVIRAYAFTIHGIVDSTGHFYPAGICTLVQDPLRPIKQILAGYIRKSLYYDDISFTKKDVDQKVDELISLIRD